MFNREIKNAPSAFLSSISRREFQEHERSAERHSPSARASRTSRTSRVFLKIPKCFYNSTMLEEQVFFIFFIKFIVSCALIPMT